MYLENYTLQTNIPRKGIARPQTQFPHSCVYERFKYFHDCSAYSPAGNTVCGPILENIHINRSQTHECGNWDWGRTILRKGIHKWDFRCNAMCLMLNSTCLSEIAKSIFWSKTFQHNTCFMIKKFFGKNIKFIINALSPLACGEENVCFFIQIRMMIPPLTRYWYIMNCVDKISWKRKFNKFSLDSYSQRGLIL